MIIVDERDYLKPKLEEMGFGVFDFFENYQVLDTKSFSQMELKRRGEFLLVDTQTLLNHPNQLENFKILLNTFIGAVFFHDHSNVKAQEWVQNEGAFLTKIIGEYSLPMPQLNWTMLSNQMQFFWNLIEDQKKLQQHMAQFSSELDQVLQNAEFEMVKAKKIHDTLIPRRIEDIKGVIFSNKYAAGDGGGGEFYDLHQTPSKVYQIMVSSQSYLISSAILGVLSQHREKDFNPTRFLKDAHAEIQNINAAKSKKSGVDLLLLEFDLNTLALKLLTESKAEFYSRADGQLHLSLGVPHPLGKGEKLVVFSPGFIFNWKEGLPDKNIASFLKNHAHMASAELISELFFQLKQDQQTQFLKKDATVVMMEVNRHGIHKV